MHGHLNVSVLKHFSLCIAAPLILRFTPSAKLRCHFQSFPLLSNNFVLFQFYPVPTIRGCALQAFIFSFTSGFEYVFLHYFYRQYIFPFYYFPASYNLFTPQHLLRINFFLHFSISNFYNSVHPPLNHNAGGIFHSQILPKSLVIPKTLMFIAPCTIVITEELKSTTN